MTASADEVPPGSSTNVQQHHIPAWKKLGLKLKFAKDSNTRPIHENGKVPNFFKRARRQNNTRQGQSNGTSSEGPLTKKRRTAPPQSPPPQVGRSSPKALTPSIRRGKIAAKKKVSFTPETKVEDGDSSKTLIAAWETNYEQFEGVFADQIYNKSSSLPAQTPQSSVPDTNTKKKKQKAKKGSTTPYKFQSALDYLTQYRTTRDRWKYNKNREVWLLKHILSTKHIPASYNLALASYIHGLKSTGAITRLVAQCHEALPEARDSRQEPCRSKANENDTMEDPERRREYHEIAKRRFKRSLEGHLDQELEAEELQDPDYQEWLTRRRRAELLLWAVEPGSGSSEERTEAPFPSTQTSVTNGVPPNSFAEKKKKKKKKKRRTAVVEVESSSSEEDEETEDSDDDEDDDDDGESNSDDTTSKDESRRSATADTTSSEGSSSPESSSEAFTAFDSSIPSAEDDSEASTEHDTTSTRDRRLPNVAINSDS